MASGFNPRVDSLTQNLYKFTNYEILTFHQSVALKQNIYNFELEAFYSQSHKVIIFFIATSLYVFIKINKIPKITCSQN